MKNKLFQIVLLMGLAIAVFSCEKEEVDAFEDCLICYEVIYEYQPYTCWRNGLPATCFRNVTISNEPVECQEEVEEEGRRVYCIQNEDIN